MKDERYRHELSLEKSYNSVYDNEIINLRSIRVDNWPRNREEALIKWAGSGKRLLEIGFGPGHVLYNLRNRFEELYGIELSSRRVEEAQGAFRRAGVSNVRIAVGNIENGLDFPEGHFDCILWADVIEHIIDLWAAMKETRRLLRKGGCLLTTTPNIAELRRRLKLLFGTFPSTSGANEGINVREGELFDGGHVHYFTFSMLEKLYRKYGIEPLYRYGFGRLGHLHNLWPSLLSSAICIKGVKK